MNLPFMSSISGFFAGIGSFALASLLPAVILSAIGILVIFLVMKIVNKALEKTKLEKAAHRLITSLIRVVLYLLLCLIVASKLGIDVTGVVALASVLTLAISLAVQNALTNVISGFTLLSTKPFASGHFVEIAGQSGTVKEIGLTYTKLITADNKEVSIPNSAVTSAQITNFTITGTRRVEISVSASYESAVGDVLAALKEAAQVPTALETPGIFCAVKNYGESSIEYVLHVWSTAEDYWTTLFNVNARIKEVLDEKGLKMTYPHLNVHIDK